jgi:hypothetical protein
MASKFADGFDYLSIAQSNRKWDNVTGSLVTGLFGYGSALQGAAQRVKTLGANYTTGFVSFHYYTGDLQADIPIAFMDANTVQVDLRRDATGGLQFSRNGTLLGSVSTSKLVANTVYNMVVKLTVDASAGVAEVKINGTLYLTLSSQNTKATSNTFFNQLRIDTAASRTQRHDNFVFWDTSATSGNDLTGYPSADLIVDSAWVTGAGADAQWTPLSGTNASNVDDNAGTSTGADDDTTYNSSLTPGQIDDFAVGALHAGSGTIITIAVNTVDRIDDATPHTASHHIKSSSATADSAVFSPSAGYMNHQSFFPLDPNTSAAPTVAARNAMNVGYNLVS